MLRRHTIGMLVLLGCATVSGQPQPRATAKMINAAGATVGTAMLTPTIRGGVLINITLNGLPAGTHALHIHTVGKCAAPDFASAGPHFNPGMKEHGTANPKGSHAGDLPNVEFLGRGQDDVSIATGDVTLAPGPNSLFHPGGTALVIHANADDNKTDPAGMRAPASPAASLRRLARNDGDDVALDGRLGVLLNLRSASRDNHHAIVRPARAVLDPALGVSALEVTDRQQPVASAFSRRHVGECGT